MLQAEIRLRAPAKINVFLEIVQQNRDGFHEIQTVIRAIDRYDQLTVWQRDDHEVDCQMRWGWGLAARCESCFQPLPLGRDNLVDRALRLLQARAKVRSGISVRLVKRIPAQAGLGGASSDAAAALVAAHRLWQLTWPSGRLAELAAEIGSDVPFFVHGYSMAMCRGRGQRVESMQRGKPMQLVVARPLQGLATAHVYAALTDQERGPANRVGLLPPTSGSAGLRDVAGPLFNRLQGPALRLCSATRNIAAQFERASFLGHQLTGSGSCYFGVCRSHRHARRMTRLMGARCPGYVFKATTLGGASAGWPVEFVRDRESEPQGDAS